MKLLIDTNVIIQLEDAKEIKAQFADLQRKCQEHGISVFVHEASLEDIERDPDKDRRRVTLSKVKKFRQLKGVHVPSEGNWQGSTASCRSRMTFATLRCCTRSRMVSWSYSLPRTTASIDVRRPPVSANRS